VGAATAEVFPHLIPTFSAPGAEKEKRATTARKLTLFCAGSTV
jgi:hypothetical protein